MSMRQFICRFILRDSQPGQCGVCHYRKCGDISMAKASKVVNISLRRMDYGFFMNILENRIEIVHIKYHYNLRTFLL